MSVQETLVELRRERVRSSRTGRDWGVLVVFSDQGFLFLAEYAEKIKDQVGLRAFDRIGWVSPEAFCVLLPECSVERQQALAESVCQRLRERELRFEVTLYSTSQKDEGEDAKPAATADASIGPIACNAVEVEPIENLFCQRGGVIKRAFDIGCSSLGLVLLSPLWGVIALAIRLESPGSAIFRQERIGRSGRPFQILKFRTMVEDAESQHAKLLEQNEQDGPAFKMERDPRVTRVGGLLRRTCLDELPQLWNVLRGEMSIVGPRPLPTSETNRCLAWQHERLDVKPGLTCYWQVTRSLAVPFEDWMRQDISYARRRPLRLDIWLILKTAQSLLLGRGGSNDSANPKSSAPQQA